MARYLLIVLIAFTQGIWAGTPLPVDQAFTLTASSNSPDQLHLHFQIAPGYQLYRDKISTHNRQPQSAHLGTVHLPAGHTKTDPILGTYQALTEPFSLHVPILPLQTGPVTLQVDYQGCATSGFCYPPISKEVNFTVRVGDDTPLAPIISDATPSPSSPVAMSLEGWEAASEDQNIIAAMLASHSLGLILGAFLLFGLLLSFTPCVLPMLPIVSAIVMGQSERGTRRGFLLSLTYVLSMACTYAVLGLLTGYLGQGLQGFLQAPAVIIASALLLCLLGLALCDVFQFRLPTFLDEKCHALTERVRGGSYGSVVVMGALATLVISPCVTPPLVGTLLYIGQSGDALLGGLALFMLGLGMGIPIMLVATSANRWLPHSGPWMDVIKKICALILFAMAIWLVSRILPAHWPLVLWGTLLITGGAMLHIGHLGKSLRERFFKGCAWVIAAYGMVLFGTGILGHEDPWHPFSSQWTQHQNGLHFLTVADSNALEELLSEADKPIILDFYADWCIACKKMEAHTLPSPAVKKLLAQMTRLRADVTDNGPAARTLMKRYQIVAPPTFLFFDNTGKEHPELRIVGEQSPTVFAERLGKIIPMLTTAD